MQQTGEDYLRGLREDHARFSRVLSMIGRDARRLVDDPDAVIPLFAEAVDYVVSFQNIYHHPREEVMFAKIAANSARLAAAAKALSGEHDATAGAGSELLSLMKRVSREPSRRASREQLARRLERFARAMRGHIAREEELLYSQAWTELTPEDWDDLTDTAAVDPLEDAGDERYPLLASYVSEGQTRSDVAMPSGPLGEVVAAGMKRVNVVTDQLGAINSMVRRQSREACALSRKYVKAMPVFPAFQPATSIRVGFESAGEFGRAYMRWLGEWGEIYRRPDAG